MDPYHYVNLPKDANAYDQQRDCRLRNCVIEAIVWHKQVLKLPTRHATRSALCCGSSHTSSGTYISRFMPDSLRTVAALILM